MYAAHVVYCRHTLRRAQPPTFLRLRNGYGYIWPSTFLRFFFFFLIPIGTSTCKASMHGKKSLRLRKKDDTFRIYFLKLQLPEVPHFLNFKKFRVTFAQKVWIG